MNTSLELVELTEKKKELEEAEKACWQGFISVLGIGLTFTGGCVLAMLTIEETPSWVIYLAIGGIIFTFLLCFLLYISYKEAKKKKKKKNIEDKSRQWKSK